MARQMRPKIGLGSSILVPAILLTFFNIIFTGADLEPDGDSDEIDYYKIYMANSHNLNAMKAAAADLKSYLSGGALPPSAHLVSVDEADDVDAGFQPVVDTGNNKDETPTDNKPPETIAGDDVETFIVDNAEEFDQIASEPLSDRSTLTFPSDLINPFIEAANSDHAGMSRLGSSYMGPITMPVVPRGSRLIGTKSSVSIVKTDKGDLPHNYSPFARDRVMVSPRTTTKTAVGRTTSTPPLFVPSDDENDGDGIAPKIENLHCAIERVSVPCRLDDVFDGVDQCSKRNWTAGMTFHVNSQLAGAEAPTIFKIFVAPFHHKKSAFQGDSVAVQDKAWLAITPDDALIQNPRKAISVTLIASCCLRQVRVLAETVSNDEDDCQFDFCNEAHCPASSICTPDGQCLCPLGRTGPNCENASPPGEAGKRQAWKPQSTEQNKPEISPLAAPPQDALPEKATQELATPQPTDAQVADELAPEAIYPAIDSPPPQSQLRHQTSGSHNAFKHNNKNNDNLVVSLPQLPSRRPTAPIIVGPNSFNNNNNKGERTSNSQTSCPNGYLCCVNTLIEGGDANKKVYFDPFGFFECCQDGTVAPRGYCTNKHQQRPSGSKSGGRLSAMESSSPQPFVETSDSPGSIQWPQQENNDGELPSSASVKIIPQLPRISAMSREAAVNKLRPMLPKMRSKLLAMMRPAPFFAPAVPLRHLIDGGTTAIIPSSTITTPLPPLAVGTVVMTSGEQLINCNNNYYSLPNADRPFFSCCGNALYFWLTERCLNGNKVVSRVETGQDASAPTTTQMTPRKKPEIMVTHQPNQPPPFYPLIAMSKPGGREKPVVISEKRKSVIEKLIDRILSGPPKTTESLTVLTTTSVPAASSLPENNNNNNKVNHQPPVSDAKNRWQVVSMVCNGAHYVIPAAQRDHLGCCGSHLYFPSSQKCKV